MPKLQEQKQLKKQTLLASAYKLFMEKGVQKTSIDEIVRHSNVAKGTFYLYFKDKVDLMQQLCTQLSKKVLLDAYVKVLKNPMPEYEDRVIQMLDNILDYFQKHKNLLNMIERNFSWPLIETELKNDEDNSLLHQLKADLLLNPYQPDHTHEDIFRYLFSIVALCGTVAYSSIIQSYPAPIEDMKPILYNMVRSILKVPPVNA